MKKIILIITLSFLSLQCISPVFALEDTLFNVNKNERVLRLGKQQHNNICFMPDYDNPDNLMIVATFRNPNVMIFNLDDNLNILDSNKKIPNASNDLLGFKMNNLFYGLSIYKKELLPLQIDSILMYCYNADGENKIFNKKVFDSFGDSVLFDEYDYSNFFVTKEKNVFIHLKKDLYSYHDYDYNRFIIVDTLGNVLKDKSFSSFEVDSTFWKTKAHPSYFLIEHNNNFEYQLVSLWDSSSFSISLDKQTLEVIDTASYGDSLILVDAYADINDSIGVSASFHQIVISSPAPYRPWGNIFVFDHKNHNVLHTIKFYLDGIVDINGVSVFGYSWEDYYKFQKATDFTNPDSIYYCYLTRKLFTDGEYESLHLVNFSINGTINYEYDFEFLDKSYWLHLIGIKAMSDGSAVITIHSDLDYQTFGMKGNIIKFDPYGKVSLDGVQGDKPMLVSYPNPAKDNINFSCSEVIKEIEIFNIVGQQVYEAKVNDKFMTLDVTDFVSGSYLAKIFTDKGVITKKFLVE